MRDIKNGKYAFTVYGKWFPILRFYTTHDSQIMRLSFIEILYTIWCKIKKNTDVYMIYLEEMID